MFIIALVFLILKNPDVLTQGTTITGTSTQQINTTLNNTTPTNTVKIDQGTTTVVNSAWKDAALTGYTSWVDQYSKEATDFNGWQWRGNFAYLDTSSFPDNRLPEAEVSKNNIVSFYTTEHKSAGPYAGKCIEVKNPKNGKTLLATILDTCSDSDCPNNNGGGCCTTNASKGGGILVDMERYTLQRLTGKTLDKDLNGLDIDRVQFRITGNSCWTGPGKIKVP